MSRNRSRLVVLCSLAGLLALWAGGAQATLSPWDGISPAPNDSTSWSGLGGDGTTLAASFTATSADRVTVTGSFAGGSGLVAVQCPASPSCSWTGGFPAGDTAVWAFDGVNGVGTGPLTLAFRSLATAGGLDLQADAPGAFTALVEAFNGASFLGAFPVASDAAGDPVFVGVQDTFPEITSLSFGLITCGGGLPCDVNDFAVDTLFSIDIGSPVCCPEPTSILAFASALVGFGGLRLRWRRN